MRRCSLSGTHQVLSARSSFPPLLPLPPKLSWGSNEIKGMREKTHSAGQEVCLKGALFSPLLPSFLTGPSREQSKNTCLQMYSSAMKLGEHKAPQTGVPGCVHSSSLLEACAQGPSTASENSCRKEHRGTVCPGPSSGAGEPLFYSARTEHPQGAPTLKRRRGSCSRWACGAQFIVQMFMLLRAFTGLDL